MTGLEKTLESLNKSLKILKDAKYKVTDETYKLSYNNALDISIMAYKNDIEMVESRIEQETK